MNPWWKSLLAGLQAGMAAALLMLLWLAVSSLWYQHSIWWIPNLTASTFYGDVSLTNGFGRFTVTGIALPLTLYSVLGALFGLVFAPWSGRIWIAGAGLTFGICLYLLLFRIILNSTDPQLSNYGGTRQLLLGHVVYGLLLGRLRRYSR